MSRAQWMMSCAGLVVLLGGTARAELPDLQDDGDRAFQQRDFRRAADLFREADAVAPSPALACKLGDALDRLHRFDESARAYDLCAQRIGQARTDEDRQIQRSATLLAMAERRMAAPRLVLPTNDRQATRARTEVTVGAVLLGIGLPILAGGAYLDASSGSGSLSGSIVPDCHSKGDCIDASSTLRLGGGIALTAIGAAAVGVGIALMATAGKHHERPLKTASR